MSQIKKYWRSFSQREDGDEHKKYLYNEFQKDASVLEDPVSRRSFLKVMGASAALAGLAGCSFRKPVQKLRPYARRPEDYIPGKSVYYASAMQVGDEVVGLLAETQEGRPTKLEGNPGHPASNGALKSYHQAAVLDLYDPDRVIYPLHKGEKSTWAHFDAWMADHVKQMEATAGAGTYLLTETQLSPTNSRLLSALREKFPQLSVLRYDSLNQDAVAAGLRAATGKSVVPQYRLETADIIVSFGSDFLANEAGNMVYTKAFANRRDPEAPAGMNRLYAIDQALSVTTSRADHYICVKGSEIEPALWTVAAEVFKRLSISSPVAAAAIRGAQKYRGVLSSQYVSAIVEDLLSHRGRSLVVAGVHQSETVHGLVYHLNAVLGNVSSTVVYYPYASRTGLQDLRDLSAALKKEAVKALFVLGGNPVYASPADLPLAEQFKKTPVVHLSHSENETSSNATWVIPRSHFLEAWGDLRALDGTSSLVQPMIQPLYGSKTDAEILARFLGRTDSDYALVRETFGTGSWKKALHEGVFSSASAPIALAASDSGLLGALSKRVDAPKVKGYELSFVYSNSVMDGRFANNGWLQELPDPITKLTWDNAALVSAKTAKALEVETGNMISLTVQGRELTVPVHVMPGQSNETIILAFGYGRTVVGRVGEGAGFNAYSLWTGENVVPVSKVEKTRKKYKLANTQEHGNMQHDRPIVREGSLEEYKKDPKFARHAVHTPPLISLWEERPYSEGYQWGLSIDLSRCTGCSACITACQSENNIPVVGKSQVLNGREMHWIRLDRYFVGETDQVEAVHQPVTCLQCENAPCEQVCPVAATTHSQEGLNDMVYNRCIGTRYCSNNCPVKVRRFNFFDFHQKNPQSVEKDRQHFFDYFREPDPSIQKQFNPDVTVRMRGVMEKCTYCVQRINEARITSKIEEREIRDGEIMTACQQTCPADAIVFGNILDPNSKVSKRRASDREYHLLEELHLKPRTTYLAVIRNPHPKLAKVVEEKHHG